MDSESDSEKAREATQNGEIINTQIITLEKTKKFSIYCIHTRLYDHKKVID
jgi:hypothetical protein